MVLIILKMLLSVKDPYCSKVCLFHISVDGLHLDQKGTSN